jgi:hypothetical protein
MEIAGRKVNPGSLEIEGVDSADYPDFCDAYFCYAEYDDGTVLDDAELEELSERYGDVINMMAHDCVVDLADDAYDRWKDNQHE